jgi:hypothetical protein
MDLDQPSYMKNLHHSKTNFDRFVFAEIEPIQLCSLATSEVLLNYKLRYKCNDEVLRSS